MNGANFSKGLLYCLTDRSWWEEHWMTGNVEPSSHVIDVGQVLPSLLMSWYALHISLLKGNKEMESLM